MSSKVFIYKGMLAPDQVERYFVDLRDPDLKSAIALIHSRFSTNTFPTWDLAQPFRITSYNVCYTKLLRLGQPEQQW